MEKKPDFKHSFTRRCRGHDYRAPFIYHIILSKADDCECFGRVKGDAAIAPGQPGCAYIERSPLGNIIESSLRNWQKDFPIIKLYQYSIMPDHAHILLRVMSRSEMHLGFYITKLKGLVRQSYSALSGREIQSEEIFRPNYCDKPLIRKRSLDGLFRYIRENPHRLAMRQQKPEFFRRSRHLKIGDRIYEAYGNLFLFRNPDKIAVKISRFYSKEERERRKDLWLDEACGGSVMVSPFISSYEKLIRREAESMGSKIILIVPECFPERYKPSSHDFELCAKGKLLIISLGLPPKTVLSREICLKMNALAAEIEAL